MQRGGGQNRYPKTSHLMLRFEVRRGLFKQPPDGIWFTTNPAARQKFTACPQLIHSLIALRGALRARLIDARLPRCNRRGMVSP